MFFILALVSVPLMVVCLVAVFFPLPIGPLRTRRGAAQSLALSFIFGLLSLVAFGLSEPFVASEDPEVVEEAEVKEPLAEASRQRLERDTATVWEAIIEASASCAEHAEAVRKTTKSRDSYEIYKKAKSAEGACESAADAVMAIGPPASASGETREKYVSAIETCSVAFGSTAIGFRQLAKLAEGTDTLFEYRKWSEAGVEQVNRCRTGYDDILRYH